MAINIPSTLFQGTGADEFDLATDQSWFQQRRCIDRGRVPSPSNKELDPNRWCSHTAWDQEFWLILAQWTWNLRLELGHALHPTAMHTTESAPASAQEEASAAPDPVPQPLSNQLPSSMDRHSGHAHRTRKDLPEPISLYSPMGLCAVQASQPLYAQERRPERNGSLRVLYAARIGHCRACSLREQCQESATTFKARRKSRRLLASPFTFLGLK